jgi:subtilisin-like proprotein convertase family protein
VLDSQPTADVTIAVSSSDTGEGTVSSSSLRFTPDRDVAGGWNVPQTVTVTGVDDPDPDGSVAYTIVLAPASSTDATYNGLDPTDVAVTNQDNDGQGNTFESQDVPKTIADPHPKKGPKPATSELVIESTGITVDLIDADVAIDHANMSDLTTVTLTSPGGTEAFLAYDGANWYLINAAAYYGESLDGTWTLTVIDTVKNGLIGTLNSWSLIVTPQAGASAHAASVLAAAIQSQAVSEPARAADSRAGTNDPKLRVDPRAADVVFAESDAHPIVSDIPTTAPDEVDDTAIDAAIGDLGSDPLDAGLDPAVS